MPLDINGIHQFTETDSEATASDLLNLLAASTSSRVGDLQAAIDTLNNVGEWSSYTPTFGNVTDLGGGSVDGRYTRIGDTVHVHAALYGGSSMTMSGNFTVSTPTPVLGQPSSALLARTLGTASAFDSDSGTRWTGAVVYSSNNQVRVISTTPPAGGSYNDINWDADTPAAPSADVQWHLSFTYEAGA